MMTGARCTPLRSGGLSLSPSRLFMVAAMSLSRDKATHMLKIGDLKPTARAPSARQSRRPLLPQLGMGRLARIYTPRKSPLSPYR